MIMVYIEIPSYSSSVKANLYGQMYVYSMLMSL